MFYPRSTVLAALFFPPRAHNVQREAAVRDPVDRGGFLRHERREAEVRPHRGHELEPLRERRQRRSCGPRFEAVGLRTFDVVQVELGHERYVPAGAIRLLRELALVREGRGHALVLDVAQPSAEHRHPESETHRYVRAAAINPRSSTTAPASESKRTAELMASTIGAPGATQL